MIEGAQLRSDHHESRCTEGYGQVTHRDTVGAEFDQQSAGTFDQG